MCRIVGEGNLVVAEGGRKCFAELVTGSSEGGKAVSAVRRCLSRVRGGFAGVLGWWKSRRRG